MGQRGDQQTREEGQDADSSDRTNVHDPYTGHRFYSIPGPSLFSEPGSLFG